MAKPLLFDFAGADACCTDHALDELYKALADPPGERIWLKHQDPLLRDQLETVTDRLLSVFTQVMEAVRRLYSGDMSALSERHIGKALGWTRWTDREMDAVADQLEAKDPKHYTIDDWMMAIDLLFHRFLPRDKVVREADYIAVRSVIMGKIQASIGRADELKEDQAVDLAARIPETAAALPFRLTEREQTVLAFARGRAGELIANVSDQARHKIKGIIMQAELERSEGEPVTAATLQQRLADAAPVLNRDWRRVAVTEICRDANEGFIASLPYGTRVKRIEAHEGACPFCKRINGRIYTVVSPAKPDKDGATEVWVGKTNEGRSAAPRKRVGDELVERTSAEMWWVAAGAQHPNCRGSWIRVADKPPEVDDDFDAWLRETLDDDEA